MSRHIIAWDIETCPQPEETLSEAQQARAAKGFKRRRRKKALKESIEESKNAIRALSPYLGWICCISAVRYDRRNASTSIARSWSAANPRKEEALLARFWEDIEEKPLSVTWVSFNGKFFDVPYLKIRSLAHGIDFTRTDLLSTHKYRHQKHADLFHLFDGVGLDDACDHMDIPSPKGTMTGADVWPAVQAGRIGDVVQYCERDALATLRLYLRAGHALGTS